MWRILILFCLLAGPLAALAEETYRLSMLPRYSAEEINQRITPLAEHLSKALKARVEPIVASDFAKYEQQVKNGGIDIGLENPLIYANVSAVHEVVAMALGGDADKEGDRFRGIIITRDDSKIVELTDLRGKTISVVGLTSVGGFLSQKLTLQEAGIDIQKEAQVVEALENKQENVIFAVYQGDADAGFIRESALDIVRNYIPMSKIRVIKRTAWMPNWALSVKRSLPPVVKQTITQALTSLPKDSPILKALKLDGFRPARDGDYDPFRRAVGLPMGDSAAAEPAKTQEGK